MGDMHNLFGRVNEAEVILGPKGTPVVSDVRRGEPASETLACFGYDGADLTEAVKAQLREKKNRGEIADEDAAAFLDDYRHGAVAVHLSRLTEGPGDSAAAPGPRGCDGRLRRDHPRLRDLRRARRDRGRPSRRIPAAVGLWICGALVAACGASCYAECAARMPSNGGFFVFNGEAYGPAVAFVGGWAAIFVTYPASIAAIALVFAEYLGKTMGLSGWDARRPPSRPSVAAGVLNVVGLRTGPRAQLVLTSTKIAALAAVALAALAVRLRGAPAVAAASAAAPVDAAGERGSPR